MSEMKRSRVLDIFFRTMKGEDVSVKKLADEYKVSSKSISRDISEIKSFLADNRELVGNAELEYSHKSRAYRLSMKEFLKNEELITIIKILIGSRALSKMELLQIIGKLKGFTTYQDRLLVEELIQKEIYHYREVGHDCMSVEAMIWKLTKCIHERTEISVRYYKVSREDVTRRLRPVAIIFSEYYFYLIAYRTENCDFTPIYYRVDRIIEMIEHRTHFEPDERYEFDEGELRERIQLMFPGKDRKIRFEYYGPSVQAILDKLPTARVTEVYGNTKVIEAEVYGVGVNMFLLSQRSWVKAIGPKEFVEEMRNEVVRLMEYYEGDSVNSV